MKLSEIAARLVRPLLCGVLGHERWPFSLSHPLMAFTVAPKSRAEERYVELELCARCGQLYVEQWASSAPSEAPPPPLEVAKQPEAA